MYPDFREGEESELYGHGPSDIETSPRHRDQVLKLVIPYAFYDNVFRIFRVFFAGASNECNFTTGVKLLRKSARSVHICF